MNCIPSSIVEITTFRESLYRFFSECLLRPPAGALAASWRDRGWRASLLRLLDLPDSLMPGDEELRKETALAVEHARLFVVPTSHTCPFEFYHRAGDRTVEDTGYGPLLASSAAVQQIYRSWGLCPEMETQEVPDHAATELRFMAMLVSLERQLRVGGNDEPLANILRAQADFLDSHILAWFPAWMATVRASARLPYYRSLIEILSRFLDVDRNTLELTSADQR